ncbi:MAG: GDYXXLXY domain-containing protein [Verrucomicrobiota bacterium]|nr:GDYXXLXY domain-containing protein [Verrucomicrobiota bacterium]
MKLKLLVLVLALQIAWLFGTVVVQERALARGRIILLETRPVDPRDLLRGDYLALNYKISDVPVNLFLPPVKNRLPTGARIFVALAPATNHFYEIVEASATKFVPPPGAVLVEGRSAWSRNAANSIHVEYGIERYYVSEGMGNPSGKLTVQVVVPASGHPKIKEVFVDGKPYAEAAKNGTQ